MQSEIYQSEPNLLAETYRNQNNDEKTRRIEKHFDFIEISNDGLLLLGTSNLCGRIWSGSIWIFDEYPSEPTIDSSITGTEFETGVACGLWLDNSKKIVIGCDSGQLQHLSLNIQTGQKDTYYFTTDGIATEHDDSIVTLDVMNNKSKIISGGMDMNIILWDEETFHSEKSFCPAHGHIVTSVSALEEHYDIFASTSLDGTSLLWDIRLDKPASLLLQNDSGFTALSWIDENSVAIGSCNGSILYLDLRMRLEIEKKVCSQRPIFKLKFNPELEMLAVCSDDPNVYVFSVKERKFQKVYESDKHNDLVRGLTWDISSNALYSCGWDSKIHLHNFLQLKSINELSNSEKKE